MPEKYFDRKKIEAQLNELSRHIHELVTKLETAAEKEAEALRPKLKAAQERLQELKENSREAWGDLKPGLAKAWDELHASLNQAASRFKNRPKQ
jgi:ElaB/YqjD/DUF883 family membrane-anchored ribosome-binding protein